MRISNRTFNNISIDMFSEYIDVETSSMEWDIKRALTLKYVPPKRTHAKDVAIPTFLLAESGRPDEVADAVIEIVHEIMKDDADIVLVSQHVLHALARLSDESDRCEILWKVDRALQKTAALHIAKDGSTEYNGLLVTSEFNPLYDFGDAIEDMEASRGNLDY